MIYLDKVSAACFSCDSGWGESEVVMIENLGTHEFCLVEIWKQVPTYFRTTRCLSPYSEQLRVVIYLSFDCSLLKSIMEDPLFLVGKGLYYGLIFIPKRTIATKLPLGIKFI
jgi:hypothetical protein